MNYKGYTGRVEYDDEAKIFHGEVLDTKDVITFQGKTVDKLEHAFHDSIDDYLDFCKDRNENPDKPFSGKFVLRTGSDLHKALAVNAVSEGESLNKYVVKKLKSVIDDS